MTAGRGRMSSRSSSSSAARAGPPPRRAPSEESSGSDDVAFLLETHRSPRVKAEVKAEALSAAAPSGVKEEVKEEGAAVVLTPGQRVRNLLATGRVPVGGFRSGGSPLSFFPRQAPRDTSWHQGAGSGPASSRRFQVT